MPRKVSLPEGPAVVPVSAVDIGMKLICDGGFTCMKEGAMKHVWGDKDGLFVRCTDGRHYLSGQIDESGENYVGFWLAKEPV